MNHLYTIIKKEVKELLTKELMMSLVFMAVFFVFMGKMMRSVEKESEKINISILDLDSTQYLQNILSLVGSKEIKVNIIDAKDVKSAIGKAKADSTTVLLVIPNGFNSKLMKMEKVEIEMYSIMKGLSMTETISSAMIKSIVDAINKSIASTFIQRLAPDKKAEDVLTPIVTKDFVVIKDKTLPGTPAMITAITTSQSMIIPLILMMVIMYAGMMIMTSMGQEKETKTLETLLTLPVSRMCIIGGKMVGSAIVAFVMTVIYMIGFKYYMSPMSELPKLAVSMKEFGISMTPLGYLLLGIALFLAILVALSICIVLGVFTQDAKSAQTMTYPLSMIVLIPFMLTMFKDIETLPMGLKILVYAIPFSHPMMASKFLIFHNYLPVIYGMIYMAIFTGFTIWIGAKIFSTDKVLTAKLALTKKITLWKK
ncbi:MAG: ABC transporter permease [Candidatus Stahlbacteria bacterium]|nr:ABC transporter permease [Candidatus Stahlbacteria bacterium]